MPSMPSEDDRQWQVHVAHVLLLLLLLLPFADDPRLLVVRVPLWCQAWRLEEDLLSPAVVDVFHYV